MRALLVDDEFSAKSWRDIVADDVEVIIKTTSRSGKQYDALYVNCTLKISPDWDAVRDWTCALKPGKTPIIMKGAVR